jgi:hypothetical protein
MCITWELKFTKCAHTKQTDVHLYCYKYRHTRICEVEEVRHIFRGDFCSKCRGREEEIGFKEKHTEVEEAGEV